MDGTVALLRKWLQEMPTTRRVVDEASAGSRGSGSGALPELHAPLMNALALGCPAVLFLSADELRSRAAMLSRLARLQGHLVNAEHPGLPSAGGRGQHLHAPGVRRCSSLLQIC